MENGIDALAFSTGMAAITLVMELFKPGDHLIIDADLYGGSIRLFDNVSSKNGIHFSRIDCWKENVESYVNENTKAIYIENKDKRVFRDVHLAYLSWQDILLGLDQVLISSSYEKKMIEDLKMLLREKGFVSFEGFSIDQPVVDKDICWTMDGNDFVKSDA